MELNLFSKYIIIISIVTFVVYGIDKYKAKHDKWRIRESVLILLAVIGGSIGALAGMWILRHKTLHAKFKYGIPIILVLQIVGLLFLNV